MRIEPRGQADLRRLEIEQLAGHVLLGDLQVVRALARAQLRMQLARLGIDEVGRERAGVAPEERVRERAVAPEEAREVDAHEQLGERVEQAVAQIGHAGPAEQAAIGQREVEMPRDQHRLGLVPVGLGVLRDDADGVDDGHDRVVERAQQAVFEPRDPRRQRLERVEALAVADEAHDVAVDAARDLDQAIALPVGQRTRARAGRGSPGCPGARASGSASARSRYATLAAWEFRLRR